MVNKSIKYTVQFKTGLCLLEIESNGVSAGGIPGFDGEQRRARPFWFGFVPQDCQASITMLFYFYFRDNGNPTCV